MTPQKFTANRFFISAFDQEQWCPVLQTMFRVPDLAELKALLNLDADEDMTGRNYWLHAEEVAAITVAFDIRFDSKHLASTELDIALFTPRSVSGMLYLIHGGFELSLLLNSQKKLVRFTETYPPMMFEGEDRFDSSVAKGVLHKQVLEKPSHTSIGDTAGIRTVYYTTKGEEWRIPAMQLIHQAPHKAGRWNEYFERLEGMLFGYEDWQNDWWIESGLRRGGFGGAHLCCAITPTGLAWIEAAGFRALSPTEKENLVVIGYDKADVIRGFLLEETDSVAIACFTVPLWRARDILPASRETTRWLVSSGRIPDLNQHLRHPVAIILRRDEVASDLYVGISHKAPSLR